MKKFFSLFAAVLFAGSMMAADATMAAGTNASEAEVNGKAAVKCGTTKKAGDMTITVGKGATKLTLYVAAWNGVDGESVTITAPSGVTANPASLDITADGGIANNSPFTLSGNEADFKFEVALSGVTADANLTLACSKRFVVWGATYTTDSTEGGEEGQGGDSGEGGEEGQGGDDQGQGGESSELLSVDFTQGQGNWTINDVNIGELEYVWKQDNQYGMKATAYVNKANNASESWLISPAIDFSKVSEATLAISHARKYGDLSQLSVQVTKDGQNWEKLTVSVWPDGKSWDYIDATADMSKFAGEASVKIAFVYTSSTSAAATWEIKTVKIFAGEAPEVKTTFDSFEELIAADFSAKTTVTVSFENLKITGLYYSESGAKYCGIFLDVKAKNDKDIEIYFKNEALPETWKEGGKVSGTITGEWSHYVNESKNQDVWEIVPTETGWSWTNLTYTEDQTAVENTIADTKAVKIVRDGQIYIFRDGQLYNLTGAAVK